MNYTPVMPYIGKLRNVRKFRKVFFVINKLYPYALL